MVAKYVLALEEARRGLDRQAADLASLRDRVTTLLGIGGTLVTILGGLAIRNGADLRAWTWIAIAAFCGLALTSVVGLWPRKVTFSHDPEAIVAAADTEGATTDDVTLHLATQMGRQYETNKPLLDALVRLFTLSVMLFTVEVLALVTDLRGR